MVLRISTCVDTDNESCSLTCGDNEDDTSAPGLISPDDLSTASLSDDSDSSSLDGLLPCRTFQTATVPPFVDVTLTRHAPETPDILQALNHAQQDTRQQGISTADYYKMLLRI